MIRSRRRLLTLGVLALGTGSRSTCEPLQGSPDCLHGGATEDIRYLFGGELRQIHARSSGMSRDVWVVGDGGRILHGDLGVLPGGTVSFEFQATPDDARQTLLDVFFLEDALTGWACGSGGRILHTTDGGSSWAHLNPAAPALDSGSNCTSHAGPATLWRVRFLEDGVTGFAAGLWTFKVTFDGGQSWEDVLLFADEDYQSQILGWNFQYYLLELLDFTQSADGWIGVCGAEAWDQSICPDTLWRGVVFYCDSRESGADGGRNWRIVFDEEDPAHATATINDPWDFEFAPDSKSLDDWNGFLVGGTGTGGGTIFSAEPTATGIAWHFELGGLEQTIDTIYGVAALDGGLAVACGYGGSIWTRSASKVWSFVPHDEGASGPYSGPLADAHGTGGSGDECLIVGSFGFLRHGVGALPPWQDLNPASANEKADQSRFEDVHFVDDLEGFAVGGLQAILRSPDGGCSWEVLHGGPEWQGTLSSALRAIVLEPGVDPAFGVAVGRQDQSLHPQESALFFTADGGASWNPPNSVTPPLPSVVDLQAVAHSVGTEFWATGTAAGAPIVLHSTDGGASWVEVDYAFAPSLRPTGITFLRANLGFVTGNRAGQSPQAWRIDANGGKWNVSPTGGDAFVASDRLEALESRGNNPVTADVYLAGSSDLLMRWQRGPDRFAPVDTRLGTTGRDLRSIGLAPGVGGSILVGTDTHFEEATALTLGNALRFDGSDWVLLHSQTNKTVRAISLVSEERGWLVASPDPNEVDPEFGTVNDTTLLLYDVP